MQKATMKCTELKFTDTEEKTYLDMLYFADSNISKIVPFSVLNYGLVAFQTKQANSFTLSDSLPS